MSTLRKILGNGKNDDIEVPSCPHTSLVQHWTNPEDMGKRELARYECTACGRLFSYDEVRDILEPSPR